MKNFSPETDTDLQSYLEALPLDALILEDAFDCAMTQSRNFVKAINDNPGVCFEKTPGQIWETIRKIVIVQLACSKQELDFSILVKTYETLLNWRLSGSAGKFTLNHCVSDKKRRGIFYTPDALARQLTEQALSALRSKTSRKSNVSELLELKIVDPSMGAGGFLQNALSHLTELCIDGLAAGCDEEWDFFHRQIKDFTEFRGCAADLRNLAPEDLQPLLQRVVARKCLYGLDVDSAAVELAKVGLAKVCGLDVSLAKSVFVNIRHGNALLGSWEKHQDREIYDALRTIAKETMRWSSDVEFETLRNLSESSRRDWFILQFFIKFLKALPAECSLNSVIARLTFFHWKVEFADVFSGENPGFDVVLTNPPWEVEKANSKEFFSRFDASFTSLGKQDALKFQQDLFAEDSSVEQEWRELEAYYEGVSAFLLRRSESTNCAPFQYQGGADLNTYKLFLELGYWLAKEDGVIAQIVPSGIYSDKSATAMRHLFLKKCRWLSLRGFHNREALFDIHRSFKFCTVVVAKGGETESIRCSFMNTSAGLLQGSPATSPAADVGDDVDIPVETLHMISAENFAIAEIQSLADLKLLERVFKPAMSLGSLSVDANKADEQMISTGGAYISFRRELDMTNDSHRFADRASVGQNGYIADCLGHWLKGRWRPVADFNWQNGIADCAISYDGELALAIDDIEQVLLPIYEGRMIGQYDWAKKAWQQGKGRTAEWSDLEFERKQILPQYLLDLNTYNAMQPSRGPKLAYLAVGAATNSRSCISAMIGDWPCGNSVPVLSVVDGNGNQQSDVGLLLSLLACMNSFVFDYVLRLRLSSNNLNWFILKECPLPELRELSKNSDFVSAVSELSRHNAISGNLLFSSRFNSRLPQRVRRMKLRAFVEAIVAHAYKVDEQDILHILEGCEIAGSAVNLQSARISQSRLSLGKGFHRMDSRLPPQMRAPALFYHSFKLLKEKGTKWLFENLDEDEVLFSKREFLNLMPDMVAEESSILSENKTGFEKFVRSINVEQGHLESELARQLSNIRNLSYPVVTLVKSHKMATSSLSEV